MGKSDGFLTPKAIANRIKAKGLQKLRWYCQMCQKQCRDENGFKCHTSSESHQRQMAIFSDNPHKFLDNFSAEFEESFIRHLRHRHGTKRVHANMVYAELIRDRHHLHMNATKWTSLTEFVKYLGRTGKATVDETPKGWFLAYIDRDPETIAKQKALERRKKADVDEEERERLRIEKQLEEVRRQREALDGGGEGEEEAAATADDGDSNGDDAESHKQQQEGEPVKLEGVKIAFSLGPSKIVKPPAPLLAAKAEAEKDPHGEDDEERKQARHKRKAEDHDRRHPHENENYDDYDDVDGDDVYDDKRDSSSRRRQEEDQDEADRRHEFKRPRGSRRDTTATTTTTASTTTTTTSSGAERESSSSSTRRPGSAAPARPLTAVEEIKLQEERRKQRLERERLDRERREKEEQEKMMKEKEKTKAKAKRTDYWLAEGIVVKVKHKTVGGGKYYNQKGVIEQVDGRYVGQVRMLQGGDVLRLDQEFLETVLPALEGKVLVVNGEHRGERATLKAIDVDKFCATIELRGSGELVKGVAYEDIAKLA